MGVLEGIKTKSAGGCKKGASNQFRKGVHSDQSVSFTTIFCLSTGLTKLNARFTPNHLRSHLKKSQQISLSK